MPEIREDNGVVTQITTVKVQADNQSEVLELMKERARFMARQPGFVSVSLHRSEDGSHSPFTRVPQEMAAVRRVDQGGRALSLSGRPRAGGVTRDSACR